MILRLKSLISISQSMIWKSKSLISISKSMILISKSLILTSKSMISITKIIDFNKIWVIEIIDFDVEINDFEIKIIDFEIEINDLNTGICDLLLSGASGCGPYQAPVARDHHGHWHTPPQRVQRGHRAPQPLRERVNFCLACGARQRCRAPALGPRPALCAVSAEPA